MTPAGSVTDLARAYADGRDSAAGGLHARYYDLLVRYLAGRLREMRVARSVADEEDAAAAAFYKVCRSIRAGSLRLTDRDHLWRVLLRAAGYAACDLPRATGEPDEDALRAAAAPETHRPERVAEWLDEFDGLFGLLGEERLRRVAVWKARGHTAGEIARKLGCTVAAVERSLADIREVLRPFAGGRRARAGRPEGVSAPRADVPDETDDVARGLAGLGPDGE